MQRLIVSSAFVLVSAITAAQPLPIAARGGRYCTALAPSSWSFTGENPAGNAFGADIQRSDGQALASYYIVGVPGEMRTSPTYARWYATPQQAAIATLTQLGTQPVQCAAPSSPAPGLALMQCRTPQLLGVALYQAFPMAGNGFVLVMRTAAAVPALWAREAALISAVARSMRCNVPLKPASFDYTTGLSGQSRPKRNQGEAESDYSRWSGMENVHDPATGQNYWVEAGKDWRQNGPNGPGYYTNINGEQRLLATGRSD